MRSALIPLSLFEDFNVSVKLHWMHAKIEDKILASRFILALIENQKIPTSIKEKVAWNFLHCLPNRTHTEQGMAAGYCYNCNAEHLNYFDTPRCKCCFFLPTESTLIRQPEKATWKAQHLLGAERAQHLLEQHSHDL